MPKWEAYSVIGATKAIGTVEAETEEEAKEKAGDLAEPPSLCHYCCREVEIGEIIEVKVELVP